MNKIDLFGWIEVVVILIILVGLFVGIILSNSLISTFFFILFIICGCLQVLLLLIIGIISLLGNLLNIKNKRREKRKKQLEHYKLLEFGSDDIISENIENIRHLLSEKENEIVKIGEEANLKEQNLEQEVRKEYDPKIRELESCLAKNNDKKEVKNYKSQIKNLRKEMIVRLRTEPKKIANEKRSNIKSKIFEIKELWKKGVVLERERRKKNTIKEKKMPK